MKNHTVKIVVELYYDIEGMPDYSTGEGVAKMVELAFSDRGRLIHSSNLDDVLGLKAADILIEKIEAV